jgi:hypothetical protein
LDNQIRPEAFIGLTFAWRQLDIGQAILAVPKLCGDQLLE